MMIVMFTMIIITTTMIIITLTMTITFSMITMIIMIIITLTRLRRREADMMAPLLSNGLCGLSEIIIIMLVIEVVISPNFQKKTL